MSKNRATAAPENCRKLANLLGTSAAAARIGMTPSGLSGAITADRISATAEVAARGVLRELGEKATRQSLMILLVSSHQRELLKPLLEELKVRVAFREDQ